MKPFCSGLKGQMVFEFIIAAILFMGIVVFVLNIVNTNVSIFTGDYYIYSLEGKAVAVSEALVKTRSGVGLAQEWPVLEMAKINTFSSFCSANYTALLERMNLLEKPFYVRGRVYDVRIEITKMNGDPVGPDPVCQPPPLLAQKPSNVSFAQVTRFAIVNTEPVEVKVLVW